MKKTYILATFCLSVFTTCDIVAIRERRLVNLKEKEKAPKKVSTNNEIKHYGYKNFRKNAMRMRDTNIDAHKAHKKVSNNEINAGAYDKLRENVMRIQSILTGAKAKIREFYSYINDRTINESVRTSKDFVLLRCTLYSFMSSIDGWLLVAEEKEKNSNDTFGALYLSSMEFLNNVKFITDVVSKTNHANTIERWKELSSAFGGMFINEEIDRLNKLDVDIRNCWRENND